MRIKYPTAVKESEAELRSLEQRLRGQKTADRVRMLRLLKSGTVSSLKGCAPVVGYSLIQVTRWWESYRSAGLAGLHKRQKPQGQASRLTAAAWAGLLGEMRVGRIATLEEARTYLEQQWGDQLQERHIGLGCVQTRACQVEDWPQAAQASQCPAAAGL
jgi:hypothetical protein